MRFRLRRQRKMTSCNVLVIGGKGVGKTSLVQTFVNGSFKKVIHKINPLNHYFVHPHSTLQGSFYSISHEYQKKVSSVGCQEIEFRVYDPPGSGEVMEAASRLADTVLLCYRASDVTSLKAVIDMVILV